MKEKYNKLSKEKEEKRQAKVGLSFLIQQLLSSRVYNNRLDVIQNEAVEQ